MARALASVVLLLLAACERPPEHEPLSGGNARQGRSLIQQYGCGSCHRIAGVPGANGTIGPPLEKFAQRIYVAGRLPNTPENLVKWIREPRSVDPSTVMPAVGLDEAGARDVAAYLYTR
jgi:cytochrome c2